MSVLLLGRDYLQFGTYHYIMHNQSFAAISVGADENSPAKKYKGIPGQRAMVMNEDALVLYDDGNHCLLAVADAHFGFSSSHLLIQGLQKAVLEEVPTTVEELEEQLQTICNEHTASISSTTLLVAIFQRRTRLGFGVSVGDSTLLRLGTQKFQQCNPKNQAYITMGEPIQGKVQRFTFTLDEEELLLAFTDGIDECHYRNPSQSIQKQHFMQLFAEHGNNPERYGRALTELALQGVDGFKGGQDNIALVICRA